MVHAIGDRANRMLLDIFERVARENGPRDRRFRIEHAQHLAPADIPRFAQLGVIASMQPYHAIDDGRWAEQVHRPSASRRPMRSARCSTRARGSRSAATGSSRRRRRSRGSTPRSRAGRSTTRIPAAGCRSRRSRSRRRLRAYTVDAAYASFDESARARSRPAGWPISSCSTATSSTSRLNRFATCAWR